MRQAYIVDALYAITNRRQMTMRFNEILHPKVQKEINAEEIVKNVLEGLKE